MTEVDSRSRSQSLQSSHQNQRRISQDNSQRRVSIQSTRSDHSQDNISPRRISVSTRISGASFFSNFKKPTEPKDQSHEVKNRFENTYRLEPKRPFPEAKVKAVINEALETLANHKYSATHSPFVAKLLSARLLENVKQLKIERFKIVCLVTIGSKESQDLRIASRYLWNDQFDTFVSASFETEHFFALGTVYGIYYE